MFGHVGSEHQVDDALPHQFVRVSVEVLENVDPVVGGSQLEPEGRVVVFQHRDVVVQLGQVTSRVAKECTRNRDKKVRSAVYIVVVCVRKTT